MESSSVTAPVTQLKRFHFPKTVISRFVARRTVKSALIIGVIFGSYVASKAIGFAKVYPTVAARQKIAESFGNNIGIELILGRAPHNGTTAAYVAWNTLGMMVMIGGIWAFLLATKYFRGEEDNGRLEMLLAGQTTARKAVVNTFLGFGSILALFYVVISAIFILVGKYKGVDFSAQASLYLALVVTLGVTMFMTIGSLASQLMSTRTKASTVSAATFGVFFVIRAIADVTNLHWLLNLTPLGWVEKTQTLSNSEPVWLLPIIGLIVLLGALTIYYAGRRDLGISIIAERASHKSRMKTLNSPMAAAMRLTRPTSIGWLIGVFTSSLFFGLVTKSAAQAFDQAGGHGHVLNRLAHQAQSTGAVTFLGIVFFLEMTIIMSYVASAIAAIRRDEAEGYIDNFLARPVSRMRWLIGRLSLVMLVMLLAGFLVLVGSLIGVGGQHLSISIHSLLLASINALIPATMVVGLGVFAFGIKPRITSLAAFTVLGWSFLISMLSSGINLNHWIVDTSVLNQIRFAPAASPDWHTNLIIVGIAALLTLIGLASFNKRDLENE